MPMKLRNTWFLRARAVILASASSSVTGAPSASGLSRRIEPGTMAVTSASSEGWPIAASICTISSSLGPTWRARNSSCCSSCCSVIIACTRWLGISLLCSDVLLVGLGRKQRVERARVGWLDAEHPCRVRVGVDAFRRILERVVDRGHRACDRRVDVGGGLDRFDHRTGLLRCELAADLRQLDEYNVAKRLLREV